LAQQVVVLFAGARGFLDSLPVEAVRLFAADLIKFVESKYQDVEFQIETKKELDKSLQERLEAAITEFKTGFEGDNKI
jgi:F-type H+-transporting ATPase subunit alpha